MENRFLPEKIVCWRCKSEGAENFYMNVKVNLMRPFSEFHLLPKTITISSSDWVDWEGVHIACKNCQTSFRLK